MSNLLVTSYFPVTLHKPSTGSNKNHNNYAVSGSSSKLNNYKKNNIAGRLFLCKMNEHGGDLFSVASSEKEKEKIPENISKALNIIPTIDSKNGIGILEFLRGKVYFITGGTGFLGKAIIEKILRASPEVAKIYVLIMAKNEETAMRRLKAEIIDSDLFDRLKLIHGDSYQYFMQSKLVPVAGNVGELNLGIDEILMDAMSQEIDVIINSAANTSFDERLDVSVNINTRGPTRVLNFAKRCQKICSFIHISTASVIKPKSSLLPQWDIDVDAEIELDSDSENECSRKMKEMGYERARSYGWKNVYEFTKAMGEILINNNREEIPIVIIRPSAVESCYKEPYPGWIQGNKVYDPLILAYGKGYLPVVTVNPESIADIIPLDMVVNLTIAAMAKHGVARKPELRVYHVTSSGKNPLLTRDVFNYSYEHFNSSPFVQMNGKVVDISKIKFLNSMEDAESYILEAIIKQNGSNTNYYGKVLDHMESQRLERRAKKILEHFARLTFVFEPYLVNAGLSAGYRFEFNETDELLGGMSEEEKLDFAFDIESLDWKDFFVNIHIPGLKKHILKARGYMPK